MLGPILAVQASAEPGILERPEDVAGVAIRRLLCDANNAVKVAARNDWEALLAGQVADEQQGSDEVSDVHVALTPEQVATVKRTTPLRPDREATNNCVFDGCIVFVTSVGSALR